MASVIFPKKQFEKEIGKLNEKMQNNIAMFGTPFEKLDDEEIGIEVFPNRPDLLSYHGFKRAFLGFLGKQKGLKEYKLNKPEKDYVVTIDNSVKDIRPYTACAIIRGLKFDDEKIKEIVDMQEKLHLTIGRKRKKVAIGIYPLEKIKLPKEIEKIENIGDLVYLFRKYGCRNIKKLNLAVNDSEIIVEYSDGFFSIKAPNDILKEFEKTICDLNCK